MRKKISARDKLSISIDSCSNQNISYIYFYTTLCECSPSVCSMPTPL